MPRYDTSGRKRQFVLTLNEDLVAHAQALTDNLSGVVEHFLADFVERSGQALEQRRQAVAQAVEAWNAHGTKYGSIADQFSPL